MLFAIAINIGLLNFSLGRIASALEKINNRLEKDSQ
jgi:hypothetical protein